MTQTVIPPHMRRCARRFESSAAPPPSFAAARAACPLKGLLTALTPPPHDAATSLHRARPVSMPCHATDLNRLMFRT
eukprot:CAMPEP_0181221540 /NCGR_PEP_ID=MMETSP1096-20121128/29466_1 /TAXON_ID=156174 ORGANISM="Chrysochromulina ericina, Strain CCMP281" /NCGR_SAMPLE_ID=MMETSP1096 /ASSEMBLY_ACC=CAM_ASM_000453 /LENGTH=76 /DNA_ID=CAMNT_0023314199 /DNA_START=248 /DNA_END=479 /DNA_ORIENTATION=-